MNQVGGIFNQILQLFPRSAFARAVAQHRAERHARGFNSWDQFVAMLFCQLGQAHSLREICGGLAACEGKLKHLGVGKAPLRSSLAYANQHRPWQLFETVFHQMRDSCHHLAHTLPGRRKKFRFKNKLLSLDGSMIDLCASVFDWAAYKRTKGAAKLHLLLDHSGYLPSFAVITEGKHSELQVARGLRFETGTIVVFDRGYIDYRWFEDLTQQGVCFVTRMKRDMLHEVLEERSVPRSSHVVRDCIIRLGSRKGHGKGLEMRLRLVEIAVEKGGESLVFLTNNFNLAARTIGEIYRDRWQIESFFKSLKQSLRIKTFVGTSANALKTRIWAALIAMLVLKHLQLRASYGWSLSNLVALLRQQLFVYRDLYRWLDEPFQPPPVPPQVEAVQLDLSWKGTLTI